jgi:hypothetical protein
VLPLVVEVAELLPLLEQSAVRVGRLEVVDLAAQAVSVRLGEIVFGDLLAVLAYQVLVVVEVAAQVF